MIEKEELVDALSELMDGDLSEGAIEYIASDLLEKYVLFERPDVSGIEESDTLGGPASPKFWVDKLEAQEREGMAYAETEILKVLETRALLEYYRRVVDEAKARRCEEVTKEIGGDTFEELPGMIRTLVYRLVTAEAANERD